jgi:hypothetical protein
MAPPTREPHMTSHYTLSYVNLENTEVYYDREFSSFDDLVAFVASQHPDFTSYQVIVVR